MSKKPRGCKTAYDASIIGGVIYFEDVRQCRLGDTVATDILEDSHLKAIRLVSISNDWNLEVWLTGDVTITEKINFEMTLRKEKRGALYHWYAYRRVVGTLHKRYVGHSEDITESKLLDIAQKLPG